MQNPSSEESKAGDFLFPPVLPLPGLFSGSVLKIIAVITMAIDHFSASILYYMLVTHVFPAGMDFDRVYSIYRVLRGIGRTAFPIYCFLLIEGLLHTRNRLRYLGSLTFFALLSEIPFDLAVPDYLSDPASINIMQILAENRDTLFENQNVFFTLAIGLAAALVIDAFRRRFGVGPVTVLAAAPVSFAAYQLAERMHTDYGGIGVLLILCFYFLHPIRLAASGAGYYVLTRLNLEMWGFPAFLLIPFYNGKRGFLGRGAAAKYFFYIFYPAHLFLYFLLRALWIGSLL
ncbi:MAG: conjugal transfer protein TraX [Lachnospiraceae bacterium]|nr:conjugal transfer protein TraX [Lachnospiraceae bacterium]